MAKPKNLEQLRAEKEQVETHLAQEQHKLERLENRKKYLEQGVEAAISSETKKITQPSGAATPRSSDAHKRIAAPQALCVLRERTPGQDPKAAKFAVLTPGPGMFVNVRNAPRVVIAALSGRPLFRRVSRCGRSCWRRRVCTRFHPRKQTWTVLQAIATRTFLPRGTH